MSKKPNVKFDIDSSDSLASEYTVNPDRGGTGRPSNTKNGYNEYGTYERKYVNNNKWQMPRSTVGRYAKNSTFQGPLSDESLPVTPPELSNNSMTMDDMEIQEKRSGYSSECSFDSITMPVAVKDEISVEGAIFYQNGRMCAAFSDRDLNTIPGDVYDLCELECLHLDDNNLVGVDTAITKLGKLKVLNMHHNRIEYLNNAVSNITSLNIIDLSDNRIKDLCISFSNLKNLTHFLLGHNKIVEIPRAILQITCLQVLDLSNNKLVDIPNNIEHLVNLKELFLDGNCMSTIGSGICRLFSLERLHLSRNKLSFVPQYFGNLNRLRQLALDNNYFAFIPHQVHLLYSLEELGMCNNRIKELSVVKMKNLKLLRVLGLNYNQISNMNAVVSLANLQVLGLESNQISIIPVGVAKLRKLREVYLANNKIGHLPHELMQKDMTVLSLHKNFMVGVPTNATILKNLAILRLDHNKLTDINRAMCSLSRLSHLNLAHNSITMIPDDFKRLESLIDLDLSFNELSTLSENVCKCVRLRSLKVSHNKLKHISKSLAKCYAIRILNLSSNKIVGFPLQVLNMLNMRELDLSFNTIEQVPDDFVDLHNLRFVNFTSCLLRKFPDAFRNMRHLRRLFMDQQFKYADEDNESVYEKVFEVIPQFTNKSSLEILSIRENGVKEIGNLSYLKNLKLLFLGDNPISKVTNDFQGMHSLHTLDLSNCNLDFLHLDISRMKSLQKIVLEGNPKLNIPDIVYKNNDSFTIGEFINKTTRHNDKLLSTAFEYLKNQVSAEQLKQMMRAFRLPMEQVNGVDLKMQKSDIVTMAEQACYVWKKPNSTIDQLALVMTRLGMDKYAAHIRTLALGAKFLKI